MGGFLYLEEDMPDRYDDTHDECGGCGQSYEKGTSHTCPQW